MNRLGVVVQAAVLAILLVAAGWWFVGVFIAGSLLVPIVVMVLAVTVILMGTHLLGSPPLLIDLLVGLLCTVAVLFFVAATRSNEPVVDLTEGMIDGWARVLTTELPVAGRMDLLVAPMVVVGLATVAGVVSLLRSRSVWLPMAPLMIVVALGLAFGYGTASQPWPVVAGLVGGSGLLALLRASLPVSELSLDERSTDGTTLAMPAIGGFAALVGAVALAVLLTGPLPVRNETDPLTLRRYVTPDQDDLRLASPLSRAEELAGVERVMSVEAIEAIPAGTRVRVASLENYDGLGWSPDERLQPVGSQFAEATDAGSKRDVVITPRELGLPWIPTVGEPVEISSEDEGSGTVLLWSPLSGNVATPDLASSDGTAWRVGGLIPTPTADELSTARLSPGLPLDLGIRDQNEEVKKLRDQAQEIAGADPGSFAAAARLLNLFKNKSDDGGDDFSVDPASASSPALGGVIRFMESRVGNRFQFATSYAVLAQMGGIPARVAVGAKIETTVPKGSTIELNGDDLTAWPEVNISGLGWTALDPVPDEEGSASGAAEEQLEEATDQAATSDPADPPPPDDPLPEADDDEAQAADSGGSKLWIVLLGAGAVVLGMAASPLLRLVRRRKRRRGSPSERIGGAWAELMDIFVEEGGPRPVSATPSETERLLAASLDESGAAALHELAELVEVSVFSPTEPESDEADHAWDLLPGIRRGLGRSPMGKVRAVLAPGPLTSSTHRGSVNVDRDTVSGATH